MEQKINVLLDGGERWWERKDKGGIKYIDEMYTIGGTAFISSRTVNGYGKHTYTIGTTMDEVDKVFPWFLYYDEPYPYSSDGGGDDSEEHW